MGEQCKCGHGSASHVGQLNSRACKYCDCRGFQRKDVDAVNHPPHYTRGKVECIDAIRAALTPEEYRGFLKGQIIKYTWRAGLKGSALEDVQKCGWYQDLLEMRLAEEEEG